MPSVIRVKRSHSDEPVESIIVKYKKRKTETEDTSPTTTSSHQDEVCKVLRYAGSIRNTDAESLAKQLKKKTYEQLKSEYKNYTSPRAAKDKIRHQLQLEQQAYR